ncbi:MAG: hypothetical protein A3H96_16405 [Acidobacteria bacterium RIFCSPLOWO2_02_FULL_67_36]|nr:MAG: hypothetical protein A3H96_16405 [Acidobacteria bacterium RIFCSPLOWO2_02_FULL_67_36]
MACAEEGRGLAARHHLGGHLDRGSGLASQRRRRGLLHRDHLRRLDNARAAGVDLRVAREFALEHGRRTDERDAQIEMPGSGQRAVHHVARRIVAAHRIHSYPNHQDWGFGIRNSEGASLP